MPPGLKVNTKRARLQEEILHRWDQQHAIAEIAQGLSCGTNTVRRVLDAQRPGERLGRLTAKTTATTKVCTGCRETLLLEGFPERPDRPGTRQAKCQRCLLDWRRTYQHENPERNREGVRRRRARLREARTHRYADMDIYLRDGGRCWFCQGEVDPMLKYPDQQSMVVHHVHPIAKHGPDIPKNVALAHYSCNHRAKDRYDPPVTAWTVEPMPIPEARRAVTAYHYLHRPCPMSYAYSLRDASGALMGVLALGTPSSQRITRSITEAPVTVLELKRLWIHDDAPFGAGSYFVARALRQTPPALIVSYADTGVDDPRYGTPHTGAIYRACSFAYAGTSHPATEWRLPGQARNVGKDYPGSVQVQVSPKARYWTVTGSPTQRKVLRTQSRWPSLDYV